GARAPRLRPPRRARRAARAAGRLRARARLARGARAPIRSATQDISGRGPDPSVCRRDHARPGRALARAAREADAADASRDPRAETETAPEARRIHVGGFTRALEREAVRRARFADPFRGGASACASALPTSPSDRVGEHRDEETVVAASDYRPPRSELPSH